MTWYQRNRIGNKRNVWHGIKGIIECVTRKRYGMVSKVEMMTRKKYIAWYQGKRINNLNKIWHGIKGSNDRKKMIWHGIKERELVT